MGYFVTDKKKIMILRRLGNKSKLAKKIQRHFPNHTQYVEMFFGAGGMFFNKKESLYNVCNDLDNEVYNLFCVVKKYKDKLIEAIIKVPIHQTLFKEWFKKEETDCVWRAARFLMYSNFSLLGGSTNVSFTQANPKRILLFQIEETFIKIQNVFFMSVDFRKVIPQLSFRSKIERDFTFIYADPPYLNTTNNYNLSKWTKQDFFDLITICKNTDLKMAISEFDSPEVLKMVKGLNIINIGQRRTILNRNSEILITNYKKVVKSLF